MYDIVTLYVLFSFKIIYGLPIDLLLLNNQRWYVKRRIYSECDRVRSFI